MKTDVRSKMYEIIRVAELRGFNDEEELADHLRSVAVAAGEASPFRLQGSPGGNAATVCSILTIRKHIEFSVKLRLIQFADGGLLPYQPLVRFTDQVDKIIARALWAYLEREGVSRRKLRAAMKSAPIHDPMSLWGEFPVRKIARDDFRRCVYLLSQLDTELVVNRKWTYHFRDELID